MLTLSIYISQFINLSIFPGKTQFCLNSYLESRIKISVNTDISVIGFYGNIGNIGKISVDIFTHISVIKIFHILII